MVVGLHLQRNTPPIPSKPINWAIACNSRELFQGDLHTVTTKEKGKTFETLPMGEAGDCFAHWIRKVQFPYGRKDHGSGAAVQANANATAGVWRFSNHGYHVVCAGSRHKPCKQGAGHKAACYGNECAVEIALVAKRPEPLSVVPFPHCQRPFGRKGYQRHFF